MKNAIILMTALVPTTGHRDLIDFASKLPNTKVQVLINGRTFEPHSALLRKNSLEEYFKSYPNVTIKCSIIDNAPQEPKDMEEGFWEWWRDEINSSFPEIKQWDYVIASESYGANVAESLQCSFIPYDVDRTLNPIKGEVVRNAMWKEWHNILETSRKHFQVKATLFGQESVGKTTVSKKVSELLAIKWLPEYARPYLEEVGEDVNLQKMDVIHAGQAALQEVEFTKASTPAVILDTDLFSTVGYHHIMFNTPPNDLVKDALRLKSDIYFIMQDTDVPFVVDPLRYGGDKRESNIDFWYDRLEEYGLNYITVPLGTVEEKANFIVEKIKEEFINKTKKIKEFTR